MAQALVKSDAALKHQKLLNFHGKLEAMCITTQSPCFTFLIAALGFPF